MIEKTNINWNSMSDLAIVALIGDYIKQTRLQQNQTQAQLAEIAGVNRVTINQIEKGKGITLLSLIQLLRALNQLHLLERFKFVQEVSPIALAKLEQKKRKRARNKSQIVDNKEKSDW